MTLTNVLAGFGGVGALASLLYGLFVSLRAGLKPAIAAAAQNAAKPAAETANAAQASTDQLAHIVNQINAALAPLQQVQPALPAALTAIQQLHQTLQPIVQHLAGSNAVPNLHLPPLPFPLGAAPAGQQQVMAPADLKAQLDQLLRALAAGQLPAIAPPANAG